MEAEAETEELRQDIKAAKLLRLARTKDKDFRSTIEEMQQTLRHKIGWMTKEQVVRENWEELRRVGGA